MAKSEQETSCHWVQESIDAYLDGDLTTTEASRLEAHLSGCTPCSQELELAMRVKTTLGDFPQQHCPDRVVAAALDQMESKARPTRKSHSRAWISWWHGRRWQVAAVAAIFLIALVVSMVVIQSQQPTKTISPEELARAEQQVKWTLVYIGNVSQHSATIVYEEVIESELEPLVKKGLGQIQETKAKLFRNRKT